MGAKVYLPAVEHQCPAATPDVDVAFLAVAEKKMQLDAGNSALIVKLHGDPLIPTHPVLEELIIML